MYDFAKKVHFDIRGPGNKSNWDRTHINLLKSPSIMVSDSGISTNFHQLTLMNYVIGSNYYYKKNKLVIFLI